MFGKLNTEQSKVFFYITIYITTQNVYLAYLIRTRKKGYMLRRHIEIA